MIMKLFETNKLIIKISSLPDRAFVSFYNDSE